MGTGVEKRLDLVSGQGFWFPLFPLDRDDASLFRFCFGNTMQKRFVLAAIGGRELVQRKFFHRVEADVKSVKAMDSAQYLVNSGIGAPGRPDCKRHNGGIVPTEPGNEPSKLADINFLPAEILSVYIFPKEFEMGSGCSDGVWTAVVNDGETADTSKWVVWVDMRRLKQARFCPAYQGVGFVYLHPLRPLHDKKDTDIPCNGEKRGE